MLWRFDLVMTMMVAAGFATIACSDKGCSKEPPCPQGAVLIPGGTFEMGTSPKTYFVWQLDPRKVTLTKAYCIDRTEVTKGAYQKCQDAGVCYVSPRMTLRIPEAWYQEPAEGVTWENSVTFCKWKGGRLPTEAEWEFAARGTDGRLYPWGNDPPTAERWPFPHESGDIELENVGSHPKARSAFGLDDMSGNVEEWVADTCGQHFQEPDIDPTQPDELFRPEECKIMRGGSWAAKEIGEAAATMRSYGYRGSDDQTGFRCAYDPR